MAWVKFSVELGLFESFLKTAQEGNGMSMALDRAETRLEEDKIA